MLRPQLAVLNVYQGCGARQVEALLACVAWIEEEDFVERFRKRFMRVPKHYHVGSGSPDCFSEVVAKVARFDDMMQEELSPPQFNYLSQP